MFNLPQRRRLGQAYQFILPGAAALCGVIWGATGALWDPPGEDNNNLLVSAGIVIMMTLFRRAAELRVCSCRHWRHLGDELVARVDLP